MTPLEEFYLGIDSLLPAETADKAQQVGGSPSVSCP